MRIALLCLDRRVTLSGRNGASVRICGLARALLAAGHQVAAVLSESSDPGEDRMLAHAGLDVRALRGGGADPRAARLREIDWHLARLQPELVIERLTAFAPEGAEAAAAAGIAHLYQVECPIEPAAPGPVFGSLGSAREALAIGFAASQGSLVPCEEVAAWIRELAPRSHRVTLVSAGATPECFEAPAPARAERMRREFGGRLGELRIGFVGSLGGGHDLATLVEAVARACARTRMRLVLVGDGPERNPLLERATARRVPLSLPGRIAHSDVPAALSLLDVVAVPCASDRAHFAPLGLFEAMAGARAIVASATTPVKRVLRDGTDALLVSPGDLEALADALVTLAADPPLRARLGAEARRTAAARHTWAHVAERVIAAAPAMESQAAEDHHRRAAAFERS